MARIERFCMCCKKSFIARTADVARGWATYCSKSCKARHQESRTGQFADLINRESMDEAEAGWDGHKEMF